MAKKKGDEGMPFIPSSQRKAGMGDEGLKLTKGGPGTGDEGKPLFAKKKLAKKKSRGK